MARVPSYAPGFVPDLKTFSQMVNESLRNEMNSESLGSKLMGTQVCNVTPEKKGVSPVKECHKPHSKQLHQGDRSRLTVTSDESKFRADLDVQHFAPEEIIVKVVDSFVIVEAKHEEKDEYGWISRQFTRKYIIPKQCNIDKVSSKLSSDSVLSIIVPRIPKAELESERIINIVHTGKPFVAATEEMDKEAEVKENAK